MRKIESITEEQAQKGREFYDKWLARALSTGPFDRQAAEEALFAAYGHIGLARPEVKWSSSPVKSIVSAVFKIVEGYPTITKKLVDDEMKLALAAINSNVDSRVSSVIREQIKTRIDTRMLDIANVVASELLIRAATIGDTRPKVGQVLSKLVENGVCGAFHAGSYAIFDYMAFLGMKKPMMRGLVGTADISWYWPFETVVFAADRPTKLVFDKDGRPHSEDGQYAIEFSDGFGTHCWHGVRVPFEAFERDGVHRDTLSITADKPVRDAILQIKSLRWAAEGKKPDETEDERVKAAQAVQRLGGLDAVCDLIEEEKQ